MVSEFYLSRYLHFCELGGILIFLDEAADRYLQLTGQQKRWFRELARLHENPTTPNNETLLFRDKLVEKGMFCLTEKDGKPISETLLAGPNASLYDLTITNSTCESRVQLALFMYALLRCWALDKRNALKSVLKSARRWKLRTPEGDSDRAISLTRTFHDFSPLFINTHDQCRFRSLLLLKYLSINCVAVDWVFGVRISPFGAHCWIEHQGMVLNDHLENTRQYKPIMKI